MFRKLFFALSVSAVSLGIAHAMTIDEGQFFFRYKASIAYNQGEETSDKDITAYYVGGVGKAFSEKLPMKPEWEDDNWSVVAGTLPEGITFNSATRTFEGVPVRPVSGQKVELRGFEGSNATASAEATFDLYELPDSTVSVDIYSRTGQYFFEELKLPAGVAIHGDIKLITPTPPGVTFNARYFEGTPTVGRLEPYPVLAIGYDFAGEPVVAFTGRIRVADGPEFATIPDNLKGVDMRPLKGNAYHGGFAWWDGEALPKILRAIKDPERVRYTYEIDPNMPLPGNLAVTGTAFDKTLTGGTSNLYDQGRMRLWATDTDGTRGPSNWFRVGSLGPFAACAPWGSTPEIRLKGTVAVPFPAYRIPSGQDNSVKTYEIVAGQLPTNLTLDPSTGVISGTPDKKQKVQGVMVDINFPENPDAQTVHCGPYRFDIDPGNFNLTVSGYEKEFRKGGSINVSLTPTGTLLENAKVEMTNSTMPAGVTFDAENNVLSGGPIDLPGSYSANFTLDNGDGDTVTKTVAFTVRDDLVINDPPAQVSIRQYDQTDMLFNVTYDASTVVYSGSESLTQDGGSLPAGVTFNPVSGIVSGGTRLPPLSGGKAYGPYSFTLSDSTGETDTSTPVDILITERAKLERGTTSAPTFYLNLSGPARKPFSVTQPPLAVGFLPLEYELNGPALPSGMQFDKATGMISGTPAKIEKIDGYSVTIKEISSDNLSETSDTFAIDVVEPKPIPEITFGALKTNAPGTSSNGKTLPLLTSKDPSAALTAIRNDLQGFEQSVQFTSANNIVQGMTFNDVTGTVSGTPEVEFNGVTQVFYKDGGDRQGVINIPLTVFPFPTVGPAQPMFDLPRLAEATPYGIRVTPTNSGFFGGVTWSMAPNAPALPAGLGMVQVGNAFVLSGKTSVAETKEPIQVKVRATSTANGLSVDSSFLLNITPRVAMKLELPQERLTFAMDEAITKALSQEQFSPAPAVTGSFVTPTSTPLWSLSDNPDWMTIGSNGQLLGTPDKLGEWTVTVTATDAEGITASDTVTVFATLAGYVEMSPGGSTAGIVRIGEAVRFPDDVNTNQILSNIVLPVKSVTVGSGKPADITIDQTTLVQSGYAATPGDYSWPVQVVDSHNRSMRSNGVYFGFNAIDRLMVALPIRNAVAKQFDVSQPIDLAFKAADNVIGTVTYGLSGDIPGTFYMKIYPDPKNPDNFYYQKIEDGQSVDVIYAMGRTAADVEATFPPDRMIFDTLARTLKGVPSKSGTFEVTFIAYDDHEKNGYKHEGSVFRDEYNVAYSDPITLTVTKGDDLKVANTLESEELHQWTTQAQAASVITGDAYGMGIKRWVKVSEELPTSMVAAPSKNRLSYAGYPSQKGNFAGAVYKGYDYGDREVTTVAIPFTVTDRLPFELAASPSNPRMMIVNLTDANMRVYAKNAANGKSIGKSKWTITGVANLPPGVTHTINDDGITFTGKSNVIGKYTGVTITATDEKGAIAGMSVVFDVVESPDEIALNVFNIVTKVGFPVVMEPPFATQMLSTSNTYGNVRFYSNDLPSIPGITLDGTTGYIEGEFTSVQKLNFDLFVTDDTDRVTSKPVLVDVIPNLRLIAPGQMSGEQGKPFTQTISTDFKIGTVKYRKGQGTWPEGFVVNPDTGIVSSVKTDTAGNIVAANVTAEAKTYSGLTIIGVDEFGTFSDEQVSNEFSIKIDPTVATPQIADQSKTILGTAKLAVNWTPVAPAGWSKFVVEQGQATKPWDYKGTAYSASHDLSEYGLAFDQVTGTISGTPTKGFIIRDFTITVTSQLGDADTTAPFWIGVAPDAPLAVDPAQKTDYVVRLDKDTKTDPIKMKDQLGNMTFTQDRATVIGFDAVKGVYHATANQYTAAWLGKYPFGTYVKDEFNRTVLFTTNIDWIPALSIPTTESIHGINLLLNDAELFTVVGGKGSITTTVTGLPSFITFKQPNLISGFVEATENLKEYPVVVTIKDSFDGAEKTASIMLKFADGFKYFRIADNAPRVYGGRSSGGFRNLVAWEGSTNITSLLVPGKISFLTLDPQPYAISNPQDDLHVYADANGYWWKAYKFSRPVNITKIEVTNHLSWQAKNTSFVSPIFEVSKDGNTWTTLWRQTTPWGTGLVQTSTKP